MKAGDPIVIADWTADWAEAFRDKAANLRRALGQRALRIDHVGSTAVPGLAAKPIIDIQVSVADFEPMADLVARMERAGYVWRADNPERSKRYFRERPGEERTHVHVRRLGSWHEQWALLFRDYMRSHPDELPNYAALKRQLAERYRTDGPAYTDAKDDYFWTVIRQADRWAADIGWTPGPSDG